MSLPNPLSKPGLTERELEILRLIARGQSNKEIAQMLGVTTGTVDSHVHNILTKLKVANRTEAVVLAIHLGLIDDST